jgi:hypothetical protein
MFFKKRCSATSAAALLCVASLGAGAHLRAQTANQSKSPAPQLLVTILDGEGALNDIRQRTAREPIVEVEDQNHKPVSEAAVLFLLPGSGPSGTFPGGSLTLATRTDALGRAAAQGLRPNNISGSFDIRVQVSYQGQTTEVQIHQTNGSGGSSESTNSSAVGGSPMVEHVSKGISLKVVLITVGVAAAAGITAGILATRGGNATTITAGTPTIGPPTAGFQIHVGFHRHG